MPNSPKIEHGGQRAFYRSIDDLVQMPPKDNFNTPESYYSTLFHELTHSTGHESRLARQGVMSKCTFGSDPYSREELVAEMGAAFLCGQAGIENTTVDDSASYINSWLNRLNDNDNLIVKAGAQAQKAADYVLGERYEAGS